MRNPTIPASIATAAALFLAIASPAVAADPAVKCESGKLKESAKYSSCRLKAEAKGLQKSIAPDYSKCESKFADKWSKIETKAGLGACPSEGDLIDMDARITTDAAEVATLLAGGSLPVCGDDFAEGNESCDGTDLSGADCLSLGFASGTLACTPGCGFDVSGCAGLADEMRCPTTGVSGSYTATINTPFCPMDTCPTTVTQSGSSVSLTLSCPCSGSISLAGPLSGNTATVVEPLAPACSGFEIVADLTIANDCDNVTGNWSCAFADGTISATRN